MGLLLFALCRVSHSPPRPLRLLANDHDHRLPLNPHLVEPPLDLLAPLFERLVIGQPLGALDAFADDIFDALNRLLVRRV